MEATIKIPRVRYLEDPFEFAKNELLGAYLCSNVGGELTIGKITELEVYIGAYDKACHAYPNKKTPRTEVMFRPGGCAYMFFVYGMYHQFNVVVSPEGEANAILIRSLEPVTGIEIMKKRRHTDKLENLTTGPGKLCQALGLTVQAHNGADLCGHEVWISPADQPAKWMAAPRIGIDYAEEYKDKPWRFYLKDNRFVSKR